jgi:hypothetical protein
MGTYIVLNADGFVQQAMFSSCCAQTVDLASIYSRWSEAQYPKLLFRASGIQRRYRLFCDGCEYEEFLKLCAYDD